ncbi:hypothetical protein BKH46_04035 [Helicobacter sp. 12S02634-8]|uniref:FUSC family protein n=1 Tax=Helicobacter sp. 12S02634-8 TaxID=1476199 RepID=UPI000BA62AAB|nr:FUSC family protein [Helicobacter sp. 12S02634-8]PAF47259.1 hypothetical protein BKH46_04035 [Helicobacter sp. 12S02634-8]
MNTLKVCFNQYILRYMHLYDPGYFSLIYAFKTLIAVFLSIFINVLLFGPAVIVWAGLLPIHIYFLNTLIGDRPSKIKYLIAFVCLSALAVWIFSIVADYGVWLSVPVVVLAFIVGIVGAYSIDLQKVLNMVLINGLVACIYVDSQISLSLNHEILTILIGGGSGILLQLFVFVGKYGKFTKKRFPPLLFDLELMLQSITDTADYPQIRDKTLQQIESIKYIFNSQASKIKDPHTVKNAKRALFYLYRIEEIYHSIDSIHHYFTTQGFPKLFTHLQREMIHNLKELSKLFEAHRPHLERNALQEALRADNIAIDRVFINSIKIIYNKMESFRRGGEEEAYLAQFVPPKTLKDILGVFQYAHPIFRYSIKYALVLGASIFVARYLKIDHGMWIAMGAIAIIRPSLGSIKGISKDYVIGTFIGLLAGIGLVMVFGGTQVFHLLFLVVLFLFIYLKVYPYCLWSGVMMVAFVMLFASLRADFLPLIFDRFLYILIGFGIVFGAFWFLWPKYSRDEVIPNIKNNILQLKKLTATILEGLGTMMDARREFLGLQSVFFTQYNQLNASIQEAAKENNIPNTSEITHALNALKYIDHIHQNTNKLYDYLLHIPQAELCDNRELFKNDMTLLLTRYEMLSKLIDGLPYYFKEEKDGRFLCMEEKFSMIVDNIFDLQNQLYLVVLSKIKH